MVIEVNQIILENFESFLNKNPNAPKSLRKLFKESLRIESGSTSVDKKGIQKAYENLLEDYTNDKDIVEWAESYVSE